MNLSVIIPTYQRPVDLQRLLLSLVAQKEDLNASEILVVIGPGDSESRYITRVIQKEFNQIIIISAEKASVVHALNLGLQNAKHEVICLLDDDVSLPIGWAHKISSAFRLNSKLGAFGGRDILSFDALPQHLHLTHPPLASKVGTFRWDGVLIGNHHCGSLYSPCKVEVLKGANLSFRRSALVKLQIDTNLEGKGAETCWELDICLSIIKNGFEAIYDNENFVFHYASKRLGFDDRGNIYSPAWPKRVYNEAFVTAKFRAYHEILVYAFRTSLIGSSYQPGIIRSLFLVRKHRFKMLLLPWRNLTYLIRGIFTGFRERPGSNCSN